MCGELAMVYNRTENVLYLVSSERIARSCLFIAPIITISYHVIEILVKSRYSNHRNIIMENIKMYCLNFLYL